MATIHSSLLFSYTFATCDYRKQQCPIGFNVEEGGILSILSGVLAACKLHG